MAATWGRPRKTQGEQTLDVEAVHAIAPAARILYVGATNCLGGVDLALSKVLDNKLANIVSNSYSSTEYDSRHDFKREVNLQLQAIGEGIGLYYANGDDGDNSLILGHPSANFSDSSPWVTAVGGTSLAIDKNGRRSWETGWGDQADLIVKNAQGGLEFDSPLPGPAEGFFGGAGGGPSAVFTEPDYQRGVVPQSLSEGLRVSSDIAALADPFIGFQVGLRPIINDDTLETGGYTTSVTGGTSLATPIVAAHIALAQQATGTAVGFANPALYALNRVLPGAFQDILPQQNPPQAVVRTNPLTGHTFFVTFDQDLGLKTAKGYDPVTGLGSVSLDLLKRVAGSH
ncbi:peptidase [Leifsonia xyli subsp. cynodontis DSM 46306]|uniref:Peptidase S53 domain-containing protein n=1 Tax=Leifsonia xyli subsp. cynodontis DSM 46306 TaxID=1389489 RepID=U3P7Z9_LEIXC|nr:S8 family serine peptidase [Leifsonia xyli]AGW42400.1 peptidase [Leifsonia xyli subsp. cynodontis DSM 46306]